jgi:hypothetical protein
VLTGLVLLGLLAAVGLASRAHTVSGGGSARVLDSHVLLEYALLLVVAAAVIVVPITVWAFVAGRQEEEVSLPPRRNWMLAVLLTMTAFGIVSIVLLAGGYLKRHHSTSTAPLSPLLGLADRGTRAPRAVAFDWVPVIVVSALAAAALGAGGLVIARRRTPRRSPGVADALVLALDETLDDLRADLDPRAAVIAAYAQLEHVLARFGLPRSPSEAPREYLGRVLPGVGAGAASIEHLTTLYERARFSTHEIDGGMKAEAIDALETVRDELRGAA